MEGKDAKDKDFNIVKTTIIALVICLVLCISGMFLTQWYAKNYFPHTTGEGNIYALFGDSFGVVNALISALAFAGVIVAIVMQRNELRLQRKDIEIQGNELKLQRKEFEIQNKTMQLQRFENTFFNMLNLQQEIVVNLKFDSHSFDGSIDNKLESRDVFRAMFRSSSICSFSRICMGVAQVIKDFGVEGYVLVKEIALFDHYFRHLYRIIKFVDESSLEKKEKFQYLGILCATLSRYELIFLFYNGLVHKKCKELIERYSLLQNMVDDELPSHADKGNYKDKYKKSAFSNDIDAESFHIV